MLEPASMLLAAGVAALGALVQGSVGFGFALVAAPLLTLIDPRLVPGAATVGSAGLGLLMLARTRRDPFDPNGVRWAGLGLVPGTVAAGAMLAIIPERAVSAAVGLLVLVAVLLSLVGLQVRRNPGTLLALGAASGFMGTSATVGGPPLAIAYQRSPGPILRATLARIFLIGSALAVAALVPAGRLGPGELRAGLALLPGVGLGFAASRGLAARLDGGWIRPAVLGLSAVSALAVLLRALL